MIYNVEAGKAMIGFSAERRASVQEEDLMSIQAAEGQSIPSFNNVF